LPHKEELIRCNYRIFKSVWEDAHELRRSGKLLKLGKKVTCPVVAIHGDFDPHPFEGVKEPLSGVVKDFRFILLDKCGHKPWIEREAKERFDD
jgi:pimeloyl-ACP methyl ester carboxylesterase